MRTSTLGFVGVAAGFLTGCSSFGGFTPPQITYDNEKPAVLVAEPPKAVEVVEVPKPLPLPGQLMPAPGRLSTPPELADPRERVDRANAAARVLY